MEKDALVVDGFVFPSAQEAQIAIKEQKNIEIIRSRMEDSDEKALYELYTKLMERQMFKTMIGFSFLSELRHRLINEYSYSPEELPTVTLPKRMEYDKVDTINQSVLDTRVEELLLIKKRMTITIVALVFMVLAMFVIAAVNPNVGYVNTENKILNKYSAWQEDLEQREKAVKEKEAELNMNSEE